MSRGIVLAAAAALPTFWAVGQLTTWWPAAGSAVIFGVVIALLRVRRGLHPASRWVLLEPVFAVGAAAVAWLLGHAGVLGTVVGPAVFTLLLAGTVYVRRFGPAVTRLATAATLPLVAILVAPVAGIVGAVGGDGAAAGEHIGWYLVAAVIAIAWTSALAYLIVAAPAPAPAAPAPAVAAPAAEGARRWPASTRMAVQLALTLVVAFAVAQVLDPDHRVWTVLSAFVVASGNRGRGDVVLKGAHRLIGALVGTTLATWLGSLLAPGDPLGIVILFAVIIVAAGLRPVAYGVWAFGMTAALALLHGYVGENSVSLLLHRLLGVTIGALIAIAIAWLVLPVRTIDAWRSRTGAVLRAQGVALRHLGARLRGEAVADPDPARDLAAAQEKADELLPTLAAAARVAPRQRSVLATTRGVAGTSRELLDLLAAADRPTPATLGRLRDEVATAREALAGYRP